MADQEKKLGSSLEVQKGKEGGSDSMDLPDFGVYVSEFLDESGEGGQEDGSERHEKKKDSQNN